MAKTKNTAAARPTGRPAGDVSGRLAFTAIVDPDNGYILGIAEENVAGYSPVVDKWGAPFNTYNQAKIAADAQNARLGLTPKEAWLIVASSMGAQRRTRGGT